MNSLEKILVFVPIDYCEDFRKYHMPGGEHYNEPDKYSNKVIFLEDTHELVTHGGVYGGSTLDLWKEYTETEPEPESEQEPE